jgi:PAS domain S-box-containing protein
MFAIGRKLFDLGIGARLIAGFLFIGLACGLVGSWVLWTLPAEHDIELNPTRNAISILILSATVGSIILGIYFRMQIHRHLAIGTNVAQAIASGDLVASSNGKFTHEFGPLGAELEDLVRSLKMAFGVDRVKWESVAQDRVERDDVASKFAAISKSQAIIEFNMDGMILTGNENFLNCLGYSLEEIQGRHHSMFVDTTFAMSHDYREFWAKLNRGEYVAAEFKRIGKGGKEIWIQASYNPVFGSDGKLYKIIKVATEITATKLMTANYQSQLDAINKSQAVIEFNLDGTVINANDNFLTCLGYSIGEIRGRHHSMFVSQNYAQSNDYHEFWKQLNRGEFVASEFKRIGKGGKEIWIQASYNPIFGLDGKPYKVVKFATDISATKNLELKVQADSQELERKVQVILKAVSALSSGDFTQHIPDLGSDGVGQVAISLNEAINSVRTALEGVHLVSQQLADASSQLASASDEISIGAQEQASSLEETASTLEQITVTVRQNSDSAQHARQIACNSREVAQNGGNIVAQTVTAMNEINQASIKIADIITTIDEIAFQTNLLALNAAVEAARAGEQGRGFAVVASEVRNLAQRSAGAAKEIKGLIQDSVRKVEVGCDLVNRSGNSLKEIVDSVQKVTEIVTEIAGASKEQTLGIEQVNRAVSQMDSVTQRNASQTEEMSATAQTLTDQATQLRELVTKFTIYSGEGKSSPQFSHNGKSMKMPNQIHLQKSNRFDTRNNGILSGEFQEF